MDPVAELMVSTTSTTPAPSSSAAEELADDATAASTSPGARPGWDGAEGSLAEVLDRLVRTKEVWLAAIEGADTPEDGADDPVALLARHDAVAPRWLARSRDVGRRGGWDDLLVDALCDPPESFVLSSVLAHVLTFSAHRRQLARTFLRLAGHDVDDGDPITWLRGRDGRPVTRTRLLHRHHASTASSPTSTTRCAGCSSRTRTTPGRHRPVHRGGRRDRHGGDDVRVAARPPGNGRGVAVRRALLRLHPPRLDPARRRRPLRVGSARPAPRAIEAAAGGQDVWVVGGGALAADLAEAGMLDELLVSLAPVTLGAGRPLLPRRFDLRLLDLGRNGAFAVATYDVLGAPTTW